MNRFLRTAFFTFVTVIAIASALAQAAQNTQVQLAELNSLKEKVKDPDTRTRVAAFHQVWTIALASDSSEVKTLALELMKEPVASASDHIRMPAVYAIAEIANSTADPAVKSQALAGLKEPMVAGQLPIRLAAIDALNSILCRTTSASLALQAVQLLSEPLRSGNNGVRMPAMNAVTHVALASNDDRVISAAIEMLQSPLDSMAAIGGMEVRMMAAAELERLGVAATDEATKAKALGILQASANNSLWEPEARSRAANAAAKIQATMKSTVVPSAAKAMNAPARSEEAKPETAVEGPLLSPYGRSPFHCFS